MKGTLIFLAICGVLNAQVVPPVGPGDSQCDSAITDPCGGDGQPPCCYPKYTDASGGCLNGKYSLGNVDIHGECGPYIEEQKKAGCSCPPGCTTGDIDGKGQCV